MGSMFYADDTQLYVSISPSDVKGSPDVINLHSHLSAIKTWMGSNKLKLNDSKTELLLLGSPYFLRMNPHINVAVGDSCTITGFGWGLVEAALWDRRNSDN